MEDGMVNILMSNMSLDKKWCRLELRNYIKPDSRVAVFGFQFYHENLRDAGHWNEFYAKRRGAFYDYLTEPFVNFGIAIKSIKWINYFKDTPASALRKIKNSDVLVFTDGLAPVMLEIIDKLGLRSAIENYRGVIIGYGMGSVIQLADCPNGLGLVSSMSAEISFDELDIDTLGDSFTGKPLYAITDDGAVIVDNGEISTLGDVFCFNSLQEIEKRSPI